MISEPHPVELKIGSNAKSIVADVIITGLSRLIAPSNTAFRMS